VPLIQTDLNDVPTGHANLPFDKGDSLPETDPRVRAYVAVLDAQNIPVVDSAIGKIHYGNTALVQGLRIIPLLLTLVAVILFLAGVIIMRIRGNAARERLWAGMARESAHQLGTPLSSLAGWIELLEERANDASGQAAIKHMRADLERLDRVAHRFERIGREPKLESIDVGEIVDHVAQYFGARVPTLANQVIIELSIDPDLPAVQGDPVLLEWAVEVLVKNAIDALAGRGGGCVSPSTTIPRRAFASVFPTMVPVSAGAPHACVRTGLLHQAERLGYWPVARQAHYRGESRRTLTLLPTVQDSGAVFEIILH
jgi:signal transduction histidine kinase